MSFPSHWSERWGSSSLISFVMKSGPLHINQGASVSWRFKEETDWQKNSGWETLTWGRIHWGSTLEQVKHFLYTTSLNLSNTPSAAYFHYLHLRSRNNCCNYLINVWARSYTQSWPIAEAMWHSAILLIILSSWLDVVGAYHVALFTGLKNV